MRRRQFLRLTAAMIAGGLLSRDWLQSHAAGEPFDIYMTFDDGPSSNRDFKTGPTDVVLQILKDAQVSATFFLHGLHINDWDGPVMTRYLTDGHALGNHLWRQGGNTIADNPTNSLLAQQYLMAERRIRELLQKTDKDVYQQYLAQPKLFRRPGGDNGLSAFLNPANFRDLKYDPYLRVYQDDIAWLDGVYDYSGWHINGGESIPIKIAPQTPDAERQFILHGGHAYYGVMDFVQGGTPPARSVEADQGLIILMHDAAKNTDLMLPKLIQDLKDLGAQFRSLPRPGDKPNTKTVGIGYAPTYKTPDVAKS